MVHLINCALRQDNKDDCHDTVAAVQLAAAFQENVIEITFHGDNYMRSGFLHRVLFLIKSLILSHDLNFNAGSFLIHDSISRFPGSFFWRMLLAKWLNTAVFSSPVHGLFFFAEKKVYKFTFIENNI